MSYAIIYSSRTGNTAQLAEVMKGKLPPDECLYYGASNQEALKASTIFVGFWTDKGTCDESIKDFLPLLKNKNIFLFGTAGFGGGKDYFDKIIARVQQGIDSSNQIIGSFMCQGKMQESVLERYKKMFSSDQKPANIEEMIENFHKASTHPDEVDISKLSSIIDHLE